MFPERVPVSSPRLWLVVALVAFFALVPAYSAAVGQGFWLTFFGRIMIYAIAASALNLLIGYTGLVSFGHALYLGLGATAVGILSFHGVTNGWIHLAAGLGASALVAVVTGLICLRTSGMAFIMITLAFAQMFFFLGISLKQYGGDDGMRLDTRSQLAPIDISGGAGLYYAIFAVLLVVVYLSWRLVHARFGYTLRGIKANERRMRALGFPVTRYKLAVYVLSACITSVAGFFLANLTSYTSPSYAAWNVSGEMIVMVILGGMGTVVGPWIGAIALLTLEEVLSSLTQHWMAALGLLIVLVILVAKQGLYGSFHGWVTRLERRGRTAAGR